MDAVQAIVFDTTASNTGRLNGTCHLLEETLKHILYLAWWCHIFESKLLDITRHKFHKVLNLIYPNLKDSTVFGGTLSIQNS